MAKRYIEFVPPVLGIETSFNTFRLGGFYAKRLARGDVVVLTDSKNKEVLGEATVVDIHYGILQSMVDEHAHSNHAVLSLSKEQRPAALNELLGKIYGPHIATPNRKTTVIYLVRKNE